MNSAFSCNCLTDRVLHGGVKTAHVFRYFHLVILLFQGIMLKSVLQDFVWVWIKCDLHTVALPIFMQLSCRTFAVNKWWHATVWCTENNSGDAENVEKMPKMGVK